MINDMTWERRWYVCRRRQERLQTQHETKLHKEMILETRSRNYANIWANYLDEADKACKYYVTDKRLTKWADINEIDKLGMPANV